MPSVTSASHNLHSLFHSIYRLALLLNSWFTIVSAGGSLAKGGWLKSAPAMFILSMTQEQQLQWNPNLKFLCRDVNFKIKLRKILIGQNLSTIGNTEIKHYTRKNFKLRNIKCEFHHIIKCHVQSLWYFYLVFVSIFTFVSRILRKKSGPMKRIKLKRETMDSCTENELQPPLPNNWIRVTDFFSFLSSQNGTYVFLKVVWHLNKYCN